MRTAQVENRPRGYKTFFMLNSSEHKIFSANKSQITKNCIFFLLNIAEHEPVSANYSRTAIIQTPNKYKGNNYAQGKFPTFSFEATLKT